MAVTADQEYDRYVREEWALFDRDTSRATARQALADLTIRRVLDVGCGAGQELRPFVSDRAVTGVGLDRSPEIGRAGRQLFAAHVPSARVTFVRAAAEHLPFPSAHFDVVICRLALPYTDNARALAEMSRVLRPGGVLLLKIQHARFYIAELFASLSRARLRPAVHACRVLFAGSIYHVTGTQPRNRVLGGETFQTTWLLNRVARAHSLRIEGVLPDSVAQTPSLLIRRMRT